MPFVVPVMYHEEIRRNETNIKSCWKFIPMFNDLYDKKIKLLITNATIKKKI